jgi:hypothetical protein
LRQTVNGHVRSLDTVGTDKLDSGQTHSPYIPTGHIGFQRISPACHLPGRLVESGIAKTSLRNLSGMEKRGWHRDDDGTVPLPLVDMW